MLEWQHRDRALIVDLDDDELSFAYESPEASEVQGDFELLVRLLSARLQPF